LDPLLEGTPVSWYGPCSNFPLEHASLLQVDARKTTMNECLRALLSSIAAPALLLLAGVAHGYEAPSWPNPNIDPGKALDTPAPTFALRDQNGRWRSLAQTRGKVVLLAFVDTQCTSICPLTTESMVRALRLLGPAALRVQMIGINANPLATSVADVAAYTRAHEMQGRWWFLTGPAAVLQRVWRAYGVYVAAVHGDIDHQPLIVLIDTHGREREFYFTQMNYGGLDQQAEVLAEAIVRLLPGNVAIRQPVSLRFVPSLGPGAATRLAAFGHPGATVVLGPAQPHLVLFFGSWLDGGELPAKLAMLDRYAALARRRGWPEPVAVDELPTESRTAAWRHRMTRLAGAVHTPIVADPLGRLADGYGVHDLPWVALAASGRILWQHDGWLVSPDVTARARPAPYRGTPRPVPVSPATTR
jgi:cytochrome oxidase Cu insertion factor (SCO1/SenC/PrrC family)